MRRKLLYSIMTFYILVIPFLLTSVFLPFYRVISYGPEYVYNNFYMGYLGIILIFFSIKQIYNLDIVRAFTFGYIGCAMIIINLLYTILWASYGWNIALSEGFYLALASLGAFLFINAALTIFYIFRSGFGNDPMVRKTILDLGTKYDRLEVKEIAEKCKIDRANIIDVINQMITNGEIYAEYFSSSKTVAFNLQANLAEIDSLITLYKKWEEKQYQKK